MMKDIGVEMVSTNVVHIYVQRQANNTASE